MIGRGVQCTWNIRSLHSSNKYSKQLQRLLHTWKNSLNDIVQSVSKFHLADVHICVLLLCWTETLYHFRHLQRPLKHSQTHVRRRHDVNQCFLVNYLLSCQLLLPCFDADNSNQRWAWIRSIHGWVGSSFFSSAGSPFHISWSKCCLSVCLNISQGGTNRSHCTQRLVGLMLYAQTY